MQETFPEFAKMIDVKNVHMGIITTATGRVVDLQNPTADMIDLADIAIALGNICRFGGHVNKYYSVLMHSVHVWLLAPTKMRREALLHDAAEAYLGDVVKPLKVLIGDAYAELEDKMMLAIAEKFRLNFGKLAAVKEYDVQALEIEHDILRNKGAITDHFMTSLQVTPASFMDLITLNTEQ